MKFAKNLRFTEIFFFSINVVNRFDIRLTIKKEIKFMLHKKCTIKTKSGELITMIIHAESLDKVKQIVKTTFGENSLLFQKTFKI